MNSAILVRILSMGLVLQLAMWWPVGRVFAEEPAPANAALSPLDPDIEAIYRGGVPTSVDQLRAMEAHQKQLVELATPCTVGLQIGQAQGSGVIINAEGLILTAAHVVQRPGLNVQVILHDGRRVSGTTLGLDRSSDAGMVRINPPTGEQQVTWPYLPLSQADSLAAGQWVLTLGHPGGYQRGRKPVVRVGRILSVSDDLIVTDGTLVGGDSGGPLLDMHGEVIGIHSRIGGSLTANMHVPAKAFRDSWDRLLAGEMWGDVPRGSPYIGVQGDPDATEAKIIHVEPGQPADRAGIQVGDVVVRFDGKEVPSFSTLAALVSDCEPGQKVKVVVRRGSEVKELELVIGRRR